MSDDGEPLPTRAPFHVEAAVRVLQRRPTTQWMSSVRHLCRRRRAGRARPALPLRA